MRESVDELIRVKRFTTEEEPSSWTFSVLALEPNGETVLIMGLAALPHTVSEQLDRLSVSDQVWKPGNLQNEQASFMLTDGRSAVWMFQKSSVAVKHSYLELYLTGSLKGRSTHCCFSPVCLWLCHTAVSRAMWG